jgi:zinc protease
MNVKNTTTILLLGFVCALVFLSQTGSAIQLPLPPMADKTLANGLKVIVAENHEQPVVTMRLMIKAGSILDPADKAGLANMVAGLLRKGTTTRDANKISEEIDFIGGNLGAGSDLDATYGNCEVLTKHIEKGLDLLADILLNPAFAQPEIERLRKQTIAGLMQAKDDPNNVVDEQYKKYLFGDHPYGKSEGGTLESVSGITRDDIVNFWKQVYIPNNSVLFVVGDVKPEEVFPKAEAKFGSWQKGTLPEMKFPAAKPPQGIKVILINKPDATQSSIKIGNLGIDRYNPDIFNCRVMNYILGGGGFVSRMMTEIRQKRGLTYDINSQFTYNRFPGEFTVTTYTRNDSTVNAIKGIFEELNKIRSADVTPQELKETISFYNGMFPRQFETLNQVLGQLVNPELYGLGKDYLPTYLDRIGKVTAADVRSAAQKYIDPKNMLIVVVGKADDVRESLKQFGPVTEIELSDL